MKKYALLLAATLLASACANQGPSQPAATADSANQAIAAAEASLKKAQQVGYQWRDTESLITQAKEAAAKQDFATAQNLANQAEQQGQLAVKQYERETAAYKTSR
ncbi:MAG: SoxXA-binding protein [Thiohalomonadaceae bacterium]